MIIGHERQIEYLEKVIRRGRMSHAYLFYGPEGVGKFAAAKLLAKSFFCEKYQLQSDRGVVDTFEKVCGVCPDCHQIEEGAHPDVIILDTEHTLTSQKETRKDIPIDDIRELKRKFSFAPEPGKWRIAIINEAEKLSDAAVNAFLKLLEEPGEQSIFILVSSSPDSTLPTIKSRAQPVRFSLVPDRTIREFLEQKKVGRERGNSILALAAGRPGIAMRALQDPAYLSKQEKIRSEIESILSRRDIPSALVLAERVSRNRAECEVAANFLVRALRDKMSITISQGQSYNAGVGRLKEIHRILSILETTNVNSRLAMDVMFLEALSVL